MSEPAPKAKRRWIVIPWLIAILLAGGWSAYWFYARGKIAEAVDERAEAMRARGYSLSWSERRVGGYPFRFHVQLEGFALSQPRGWGVTAPVMEAQSSALMPDVVVLVAPQGLTLTRPSLPPIAVHGEALRASLGGVGKPGPWRVSVEGREVDLSTSDPDSLAFSAISRMELHFRPEEGEDAARVFLRFEEAQPMVDNRLALITGGRPVTFGFEGRVTEAADFKGGDWDRAMTSWVAAGGHLAIAEGGVAADNSLLSLRPSALSADTQGYASGELKLTLTQATDGVMALGEIGVLPPDTAAVASGLAAAQAMFDAESGFNITFSFSQGRTWLGPLSIGTAPRLHHPVGGTASPPVPAGEPATPSPAAP